MKWILFIYFGWGGGFGANNGIHQHEFATKAACFEALAVVEFHTSQGAADKWFAAAWCAPDA